MTGTSGRRPSKLVESGLNLINTVSAIADGDSSEAELKKFCADQASFELSNRRLRSQLLPEGYFGEAAWHMLLELYIAQFEQRKSTVTDICNSSDEPQTTALRWIKILETDLLIQSTASHLDRRCRYLQLTDRGVELIERYFIGRRHHLM